MEGYKPNSGKPDTEWWMKQIKAGLDYRRENTAESQWDNFRAYYRNKFKPGLFPKNLFFTMRRTIVPRVYFRNPSVSIVTRKPGADNIAITKVLERIDNQLLRAMGVKTEMKRMVDEAFITGTGIGKLGYGAIYTPTPEVDGTEAPVTSKGERVEYDSNIFPNMPWFKHVPTKNFVVAKGARDLEDSFFVAELHERPWDDLVNDPRFPTINKGTMMPESMLSRDHYDEEKPRLTIDLWEVRDKRNRKVFVFRS